MPKKFAFDAKRAFHNATGLGNYSRDFIKMLLPYSDSIGLFTIKGGRYFREFEHPKYEIIYPKGWFSKTFNSLWRSFFIASILKKSHYTHYHGLSAELPWGIHQWAGIKIVTIHDLIFEKHPEAYQPFDRWVYSRKAKYACNVADYIIAISEETSKDIQHYYGISPSKIKIVPPLCHPLFYKNEKVKSQIKLPQRFILYVGTVESRKGLHLALEALMTSNIHIPIVVVGKLKMKYFKTFEKNWNALKNKGLLLHLQPNMEKLVAIYDACEFLVYPSKAEGYGMPIIEAALRGKPSIVGTSPCLIEAGGEGAWALQSLDSKELNEKIVTWWTHPEKLNEKALQAKHHANVFTPKAILEKIAKVYDVQLE